MGNPVVHFEFMSKDAARLAGFYERLFGWSIQHRPELKYHLVDTAAEGEMKGISGGIAQPECEGPMPGNLTMYVMVDDLAAYRKRIVEAGGTIVIEEQEVPAMGAFTLFTDPEGRMMGLWRSAGGA